MVWAHIPIHALRHVRYLSCHSAEFHPHGTMEADAVASFVSREGLRRSCEVVVFRRTVRWQRSVAVIPMLPFRSIPGIVMVSNLPRVPVINVCSRFIYSWRGPSGIVDLPCGLSFSVVNTIGVQDSRRMSLPSAVTVCNNATWCAVKRHLHS